MKMAKCGQKGTSIFNHTPTKITKAIFEGLKRSLCCVVHENVDQRNNKNQDQLMENGMME